MFLFYIETPLALRLHIKHKRTHAALSCLHSQTLCTRTPPLKPNRPPHIPHVYDTLTYVQFKPLFGERALLDDILDAAFNRIVRVDDRCEMRLDPPSAEDDVHQHAAHKEKGDAAADKVHR